MTVIPPWFSSFGNRPDALVSSTSDIDPRYTFVLVMQKRWLRLECKALKIFHCCGVYSSAMFMTSGVNQWGLQEYLTCINYNESSRILFL